MTCCAHTENEHREVTVCQEQIHYPSEDYPCLCERMAGENVCTTCGHKRESHVVKQMCRPASGESCRCAGT